MTFDPKSFLRPAPAIPLKPMTIDDMAAKLAKISAAGLGGAMVELPDGAPVNAIDLVAQGVVPAHFVVRHK